MVRILCLALFAVISTCVKANVKIPTFSDRCEEATKNIGDLKDYLEILQETPSITKHPEIVAVYSSARNAAANAIIYLQRACTEPPKTEDVPFSETAEAASVQRSLHAVRNAVERVERRISGLTPTTDSPHDLEVLDRTISQCKDQVDTCQAEWEGILATVRQKQPSASTTTRLQPSQLAQRHWKRTDPPIQHPAWRTSTDRQHCPGVETACPASLLSRRFECIDTTRELTSCGGCASIGEGEDCTAIPGALGVGCFDGTCGVLSCKRGYSLDTRTGRCAPKLHKLHAHSDQ